jgi:hypothetical protein
MTIRSEQIAITNNFSANDKPIENVRSIELDSADKATGNGDPPRASATFTVDTNGDVKLEVATRTSTGTPNSNSGAQTIFNKDGKLPLGSVAQLTDTNKYNRFLQTDNSGNVTVGNIPTNVFDNNKLKLSAIEQTASKPNHFLQTDNSGNVTVGNIPTNVFDANGKLPISSIAPVAGSPNKFLGTNASGTFELKNPPESYPTIRSNVILPIDFIVENTGNNVRVTTSFSTPFGRYLVHLMLKVLKNNMSLYSINYGSSPGWESTVLVSNAPTTLGGAFINISFLTNTNMSGLSILVSGNGSGSMSWDPDYQIILQKVGP